MTPSAGASELKLLLKHLESNNSRAHHALNSKGVLDPFDMRTYDFRSTGLINRAEALNLRQVLNSEKLRSLTPPKTFYH